MGKNQRRDTIIDQFNWGDEEGVEESESLDNFEEESANLIKAIRNRPTFKGWMGLIDHFLKHEKLDEAEITVKSFIKWSREQKNNGK